MLETVEWGNFRIEDLFDVLTYKKRFDANKVSVLENGEYPYVVRVGSNNGHKGFINENINFLNEGNTISFGQDTATMYYQEKPYFTGDKIKILRSKYSDFSKNNAQFFISTMMRAFSSFAWGSSSFSVDIIKKQIVSLPVKNGKIDFDFMESFITKLEAQRIAKLEAYLEVTNLKDYHLTSQEQKSLDDLESGKIDWGWFKYKDIFNKIKQGRRLKKDDQIEGDIPFVMAGTTNTGVVNYISNPVSSFPKNSVTIDIFGNTFYRNYDYGAGDDTGVYWNDEINYSIQQMLFYSTAMAKSLQGKFSYGKKLRSSQSFDFKMKLPTKNNNPSYEVMETLISAVQKLVIKNLVKYAEAKAMNHVR